MSGEMLFGKSVNGSAVHFAISGENGLVARCDKNIETEVIDAQLDEITCAKCKKYADYKNRVSISEDITTPDKPKPADSTPKKEAEKPTPKTPPKNSKSNASKQAVIGDEAISAAMVDLLVSRITEASKTMVSDRIDTVTQMLVGLENRITTLEDAKVPKQEKKKITEENYKEVLKDGQKNKDVGTVEGKQFKLNKTGAKEYSVIHIASGQHMFSKIPASVSDTVLKYLNNLRIRWENNLSKIPKDFVEACAAAYKAALASHGIEVKVGMREDIKPPRIIKRRKTNESEAESPKEEKSERTIARRTKAATDEFGFRLNDSRSDIAAMLKEGMHLADITDNLKKDYGLNEKQALRKLRVIVRKLVKNNHPVMIVKQKEPGLDYYQIVENNE